MPVVFLFLSHTLSHNLSGVVRKQHREVFARHKSAWLYEFFEKAWELDYIPYACPTTSPPVL